MMLYTKPEAHNVSQRLRGGPSYGQAQKISKDRARGSGDIVTDRQTDIQTQTDIHTDVLVTTTSQPLPLPLAN